MVENDKDDIDNSVKKRIPKCSGCEVKFKDHGWGKPGLYCEGYHTGAEKKGEINLFDAEDHNHHIETIKTLMDSEHEDDQANDDELALICSLSPAEEGKRREADFSQK